MSHRWITGPVLFAVIALAFAGSPVLGAAGKTFTVDSKGDVVDANPGDGHCATAGGKCTLRAAVQEANADPDDDIIKIPGGTYKLTIAGDDDTAQAGDLDLLHNVTIQGAGAGQTIIDANSIDRAFDTYPVIFLGQINISDLTIENGLADTGGAILANGNDVGNNTVIISDAEIKNSHATIIGGGIANAGGDMVIERTTITGNKAASGSDGGGIYNSGMLTVTDSTISNNHADAAGGGVYNTGPATVTGSTFSGNSAGNEGGGFENAGSVTTMTNVTFSGNSAGAQGGGAIFNSQTGADMTLYNVTLAGDSAASGQEIYHDNSGPFKLKGTIVAADSGNNCSGTLNSLGFNLSSDNTCGLNKSGDMQNKDPQLGPLADNGGPTQTRALLTGSKAIDGDLGCPPPNTDQRGVARPQGGGACDIGAFELEAGPTPTPTPPARQRTWADLRCDGAVDGTDVLDDLLQIGGLPLLSQTPPCPALTDSVEVQGFSPHIWDDVDCTGDLRLADVLMMLRYLAGVPMETPPGCPAIGALVLVTG